MTLRDAIREVVVYLEVRFPNEKTWAIWRKERGAFRSAVGSMVGRLRADLDLLYAANPRLAEAVRLIYDQINAERPKWLRATRSVWATL